MPESQIHKSGKKHLHIQNTKPRVSTDHLGANSFLVKPLDFTDLIAMSQFLSNFLSLTQTPESSRPPKQKRPNNCDQAI